MQIKHVFIPGLVAIFIPTCALADTQSASALMQPKNGSNVAGTIRITQNGNGVVLNGTITGLSPGKHGFHVHEKGDCSAADATSAGGHFNPTGASHGGPGEMHRHAGDLGNVEADQNGVAQVKISEESLSLIGPNSVVGRSLIVHKSADDLKTQPSGESGDRIGCAVISAE